MCVCVCACVFVCLFELDDGSTCVCLCSYATVSGGVIRVCGCLCVCLFVCAYVRTLLFVYGMMQVCVRG